MSAGGTRPPRARDNGLVLILIFALVVGAAAVLLTGATPIVPSSAPSSIGSNQWVLAAFGYAVVAGLVVGIALHVARRFTEQTLPLGRVTVTFLVLVALSALFIGIAPWLHTGSPINSSPARSPPPSSPANSTNASTPSQPVSINIPFSPTPVPLAWLVFGAAMLAILVAVVLVIRFSNRDSDAPALTAGPSSRSSIAIQRALKELDDPSLPARERLYRVYAQLLAQMEDRVGGTACWTPGEVELEAVALWAIEPAVARELTALFEVARYSSHDVNDGMVGRARVLLSQALPSGSLVPTAA